MPVSSSVLLLQPPVRAVTVSCSSMVLIYSTSSPPSISLTRLQKRSITTIWRKFSSITAAPVRGNPSAAEPLIRRRGAPAADLQRRTPRRCAAEGAAIPAAAHRERPHGAWQPGRPASGTPSASMGPAPGRGGRSLAASGMDSRPPVSARHHLGRAGGRGGPRAVPADLRALRGAQVLRRAGGGRRRVPAVVRGGGEADGGSPARPRRLSDPTGRRGREASLPGPPRGGGEARPASLRSLPWGRLSFSRRAWAEGPRVWEPSPPAQRGCAAPSSHGAGPEVSPGRPSVRLSSLALTPVRSVRERRERPRASPLTVPAVCTAVSLSAFHCVLSAFREFTHFPFLYSCFFYPAITGQEGKSPFRLVFLRAVVPQCARRARPSEGRGVTCSSEGRCARCYQRSVAVCPVTHCDMFRSCFRQD